MHRILLVSLAAVAANSFARGQSVDANNIYPITAPIRDAGIYDMATGRFIARSAAASATTLVYNNTCMSSGAFYLGAGVCDDIYDEGRVPDSVPCSGAQTSSCYDVSGFTFAYCTSTPAGSVDIDFELFDTSFGGGDACIQVPAGLDAPGAGILSFDSSAHGFPLPGSTAGGLACWIVTFSPPATGTVSMHAGSTSSDLFTWRFRSNNVGPAGSAGTLIAGAPSGNPYDGIFTCGGSGCATGLDNADSWWTNVDGSVGGSVPPQCVGSPANGSSCYSLGGYPANPFGGIYASIESDGPCTCSGAITDYCTAKVNSLGCTPELSTDGAPRAHGVGHFSVTASKLIGKRFATFFYGTSGLSGTPFHGGFLCVKQPIQRVGFGQTDGSHALCNGALSFDFAAYIRTGVDPALVAGALVGIQCWARDPGSPDPSSLTAAKSFVICP